MDIVENGASSLLVKEEEQRKKMETYYAFQSKIYDLTRWSFLFGRKRLIRLIPELPKDATILEIGCGTGYNLRNLAQRFPKANVFGLDASSIMLEKAAKKVANFKNVTILHETYGTPSKNRPPKADVIIFSYALSMINPQWDELLEAAYKDLNVGGIIAVADFEYSQFGWFRNHMSNNHVRMENHLLPKLNKHFKVSTEESNLAYGGVWNYFLFVGSK